MARMYPSILDEAVKSPAEKRLYQFFDQELGNEWVVFHNVKWIGVDDWGRPRDGETDFIVAHPNLGILVLEAKGGKIRFDEVTGHFISRDKNGNDHDIHDPFEQAMKCKKNLIGKLKRRKGWPRQRIVITHGVIFPDMVIKEDWERGNAPRNSIIDALDLANMEQKLRSIFAAYNDEASVPDFPPGQYGIQSLINALYLSNQIRNPLLSEMLIEDERKMVRLTEQQYSFLDFIQNHTHATISGCAGSGKTFLAIEKARQLAQDEQKKVLFTCYNQSLAAHIGETLGYRKYFDVFNFHQLCLHWAKEAALEIPHLHDISSDHFNKVLPNLLLDAMNVIGGPYEAIVVDEGQDFRAEWWEVLPFLLHYPNDDYYYVFYDDNQRVYHDRSLIPFNEKSFHLDINCRNTQRIANVVNQFYVSSRPTKARGPEGIPIQVIEYKSEQEGRDQLRRVLNWLLHVEKFSHEQVAVLSARGIGSSNILKSRFGNIDLVDRTPLNANEILATTIRRFKGLERDVVVLCEIDGYLSSEDVDVLMYVGTSRAKHHLLVFVASDAPSKIKETFHSFYDPSWTIL